jgi:hypothetical protein
MLPRVSNLSVVKSITFQGEWKHSCFLAERIFDSLIVKLNVCFTVIVMNTLETVIPSVLHFSTIDILLFFVS